MDLDIRSLTPADDEPSYRLRVQAFSSDPEAEFDAEVPYVPPERRLGAFVGDRMVGHLACWEFGQWYGGRRVPMGGVAGVAIAPDARQRGVGTALLGRALRDMHDRGELLSALYPATHVPYRRLGWEIAGVWARRTVPTATLRGLPRPAEGTAVRAATADDLPAVGQVYASWARSRPGMLDRSELWTRRQLAPEDGMQLYVAERGGIVVGYAGFEHGATNEPHAAFRIDDLDLVGVDADAELALWHLIGSHASVAPTTRYVGAPEDPLLFHLREHELREEPVRAVWMSRLVDAAGAVAARGYPAGLDVTVPLAVSDNSLAHNAGERVLEVTDGAATLTPGGDGRVRLDIGALSCLFSGYLPATELAHIGRLRGANAEDLAALDAVFSGPTPWMRDYF